MELLLSNSFTAAYLQTESCQSEVIFCNNCRYTVWRVPLCPFCPPDSLCFTVCLSSGKEPLPLVTPGYIPVQVTRSRHGIPHGVWPGQSGVEELFLQSIFYVSVHTPQDSNCLCSSCISLLPHNSEYIANDDSTQFLFVFVNHILYSTLQTLYAPFEISFKGTGMEEKHWRRRSF